jgi:hypothetical protein
VTVIAETNAPACRPNPEVVADLSVVIVNWKSKDYVRECLKTLAAPSSSLEVEIIVVDGGSFDGCGEMLASEFPKIKFVQATENLGFGRSNNLGAESARAGAILLLNPDTEVSADCLSILLNALNVLPQAGIIGPMLLNTDGSLQTSCVQSFPTPLNQTLDSEVLRRRFPRSSLWGTAALTNESDPSQVEAISGACMLMRADTFRKVGGFSPDYFMYGEDMDLCRKVSDLGLRVYYVPAAKVVHHGGGSSRTQASKFSNVMMRESICRFIRQHSGAFSAFLYRVGIFVSAILRIGLLAPKAALSKGNAPRASLSKWVSLLRWAIGLERWANNYGPPARRPAK